MLGFVVWLSRKDATFRKLDLYDKKDGALLKTLALGAFETIEKFRHPTGSR